MHGDVNAGLLFAPAAHAGALFSGGVPLIVALLAMAFLHEAFTTEKRVGLALILVGIIGVVWSAGDCIGLRFTEAAGRAPAASASTPS